MHVPQSLDRDRAARSGGGEAVLHRDDRDRPVEQRLHRDAEGAQLPAGGVQAPAALGQHQPHQRRVGGQAEERVPDQIPLEGELVRENARARHEPVLDDLPPAFPFRDHELVDRARARAGGDAPVAAIQDAPAAARQAVLRRVDLASGLLAPEVGDEELEHAAVLGVAVETAQHFVRAQDLHRARADGLVHPGARSHLRGDAIEIGGVLGPGLTAAKPVGPGAHRGDQDQERDEAELHRSVRNARDRKKSPPRVTRNTTIPVASCAAPSANHAPKRYTPSTVIETRTALPSTASGTVLTKRSARRTGLPFSRYAQRAPSARSTVRERIPLQASATSSAVPGRRSVLPSRATGTPTACKTSDATAAAKVCSGTALL